MQGSLPEDGGQPDDEQNTQHQTPEPKWLAGQCQPSRGGQLQDHERPDHQPDRAAVMPVESAEFRRTDARKGGILDQLHQPNEAGHAEGRGSLEALHPRQPFGRGCHARQIS